MSVTPLQFPDLSSMSGMSDAFGTSGIGSTAATTDPTQGVAGAASTDPTSGSDFGNLVTDGLDRLEGLQNTSSNLAVQAATGDLSSIQDYTVAATEASTATSLTVALRNQAIGAFNQIMQMQI